MVVLWLKPSCEKFKYFFNFWWLHITNNFIHAYHNRKKKTTNNIPLITCVSNKEKSGIIRNEEDISKATIIIMAFLKWLISLINGIKKKKNSSKLLNSKHFKEILMLIWCQNVSFKFKLLFFKCFMIRNKAIIFLT